MRSGDHVPLPVRLWFLARRSRSTLAATGVILIWIAFDLELEDTAFYAMCGIGALLLSFAIALWWGASRG